MFAVGAFVLSLFLSLIPMINDYFSQMDKFEIRSLLGFGVSSSINPFSGRFVLITQLRTIVTQIVIEDQRSVNTPPAGRTVLGHNLFLYHFLPFFL